MTKFSDATEQYINFAVKERILRWQMTLEMVTSELMGKGKKIVPDEAAALQGPDRARFIDKWWNQRVDDAQRAHKYKATHWVHSAIWSHCYQECPKTGGFWSITQALRGDAGTRKPRDQVLRELARRYRVVDHAFSATIRRKNGTIVRIQ
jgi:hypothetical protein